MCVQQGTFCVCAEHKNHFLNFLSYSYRITLNNTVQASRYKLLVSCKMLKIVLVLFLYINLTQTIIKTNNTCITTNKNFFFLFYNDL